MMDTHSLREFDFGTLIECFRQERAEAFSSENIYRAVVGWLQEQNFEDLKPLSAAFAKRFRITLRDSSAERDLNRLIAAGMREETMLLAVLIFWFMPSIDHALRSFMGKANDKKRKAKTLREAARIMDDFAASTPAGAENAGGTKHDYAVSGPKTTADSLHFYANLLFMREQILKAIDANSGEELARYTLASAVHRITGKYHDPEVSGMMSVLLKRNDYDENMHRVWRIRTLRRLNPTCSILPTLLHAFNTALAGQQPEAQTTA